MLEHGLSSHEDILDGNINVHPVSLVELRELELLDEETLRDIVSAEESRAEGGLLEVAQCTDNGVRVDLFMSKPLALEALFVCLFF